MSINGKSGEFGANGTAPIYPKVKISRVQNGFEVFAFGKTYVFGEDDSKSLLTFLAEWVSKAYNIGKKPVKNANVEAVKEGVTKK